MRRRHRGECSAPNALILAFMGSWRTSSNAPSSSFSFTASSPSSASRSDSHPYLYWIVYGTIRSPLTALLDGDVGCVGGIAAGLGSSRTRYNIPSQLFWMTASGVSRHRGECLQFWVQLATLLFPLQSPSIPPGIISPPFMVRFGVWCSIPAVYCIVWCEKSAFPQ
ncbi:hypothetical protein B0H16DRAFT_58887 [Mycena metata]|uniref:Uncharacterized protein n=1 Tax=Mycena metata TaxID=1033252 RepID=A0AAD7IET8_9AGAR|nr:hypothetical protein B0H16DRAFT_58887 [Mycena metata]